MTDPLAFVVAVFALLAVPGPTNALLAAAGAERESGGVSLIGVVLVGYGLAISLLIALFGPLTGTDPRAAGALRLAAAIWLLWSAAGLWRHAEGPEAARTVTAGRLLVTTMLNPKTLVFAFAIFPPLPPAGLAPYGLGFVALASLTSLGWTLAGTLLARSAGSLATPARISRATAATLALFALWVGGAGITALVA